MRATTPIAAKPTPQAATESKTASATEKAPTFAAGTDNRTSARIPDEELDEAFEHLEIPDIPLEYEEDDVEYIEAELPLAEERRPQSCGGRCLPTSGRTAVRADGRHGVFRPPREWFRRCRGKDNGIDGLLFKPAIPDRRGRGDGSRPSSKHSRCACRGRVRHPGFCITIKNERTMKEKDYG